MLFRALEFSLKEIQSILQSPDFDRDRALDQQICLLTLKKEHIENLITFARGLKQVGGMNMDFSAFDTAKMDEYATKAKEKFVKNVPTFRMEKNYVFIKTRKSPKAKKVVLKGKLK